MRRTAALASTAVALTLLLGACGGDDSSAKSLAKAIEEKTADSDTTVKGGSSATTSDGATTDTTDPKFSGKGSGDFCGFAKDIEKNQDELFKDSEDPADLKKSLAQVNKIFDEAAKKAPNEIKADFKTLQKGFVAIADFYGKMGDDPQALAQAMAKDPEAAQKAMGELSSPEFEAASSRITAYIEKVCGIKDSSDTTTK